MTQFYPNDDAITQIAMGVATRSLPKAEWTHAAHFALALWRLRHQPDAAAPDVMRETIRAYNDATGTVNSDSSGYHHTITIASLRGAAAQLAAEEDTADTATPLHTVLDTLMASPLGQSGWLLEYWSKERLFSPDARRAWVGPDLKPLPF